MTCICMVALTTQYRIWHTYGVQYVVQAQITQSPHSGSAQVAQDTCRPLLPTARLRGQLWGFSGARLGASQPVDRWQPRQAWSSKAMPSSQSERLVPLRVGLPALAWTLRYLALAGRWLFREKQTGDDREAFLLACPFRYYRSPTYHGDCRRTASPAKLVESLSGDAHHTSYCDDC